MNLGCGFMNKGSDEGKRGCLGMSGLFFVLGFVQYFCMGICNRNCYNSHIRSIPILYFEENIWGINLFLSVRMISARL